jgi:hypothetical protein
MVELLIQNGDTIYAPIVPEGITLDLERGQAGKLAFSVIKDGAINFTEGNTVSLRVGGRPMFLGFVFSKQRDRTNEIKVVAYDQMRYLKNKDTYVYTDKKASDIVKMIAEDFRLQLGDVEDTGYVIPKKVEDSQTLLDIILNALDDTLIQTGKLFVLYDDFGRLALKNVETLKLDLGIDEETGENFDYTSSIDNQTYNRIKLSYDNEETGKRDIFIAQDGGNIDRWGVLQFFDALKDPARGKAKADALLELYNRKTRSLQIKGAFGDARVRAGSAVIVRLNLGDTVIGSFMMVEKVRHAFNEGIHQMDLALRGGDFLA